MSVIHLSREVHQTGPTTTDVDIVVPVYNEADQLRASITTLREFLDSSFPFCSTITIVDNASTDDTWRIATELADGLSGVAAVHLNKKGRGLALRTAWSKSTATVVAYMDVDLATGLEALLPLVAPLLSGHSDVAIGTRLAPGAHVIRGTKREFISRSYNLLLRSTLRSAVTDAQCGFKAIRREAALELLPLVEDNEWFFDTELLVTAQRAGLRIHEVPVDWVDDLDSRVEVVHTAWKDLRGVYRMLHPATVPALGPNGTAPPAVGTEDGQRTGDATPTDHQAGPPTHQPDRARPTLVAGSGTTGPDGHQVFSDELLRFAGVGAVSTAAYAALFATLEPSLGSYTANAVAIGLCSLGNTAAHRGMAGTAQHGLDRRHRWVTAGALLGVSLTFTTASLAATRALGLRSLAPELTAVTVANLGAAVIRFGILRSLVFRPEFGTHLPAPTRAPLAAVATPPSA